MDDEYEFPFDPAKLLPLVCQIEPDDPSVEKLPKQTLPNKIFDPSEEPLY